MLALVEGWERRGVLALLNGYVYLVSKVVSAASLIVQPAESLMAEVMAVSVAKCSGRGWLLVGRGIGGR